MMPVNSDREYSGLQIVLVVTDNSQTAALWVSLFREKGWTVIAETPDWAVKTGRILAPWLVLVDVGIPHDERMALCRGLKSVSRGALLMLIPSRPREIIDAYAAGVDECILQPVSPAMVTVKAMAWMVRRQLMGSNNFVLESFA
ncbi:MAG TPA: response regulator [Anaerolineales bacterium]|nr:response regulator [Anaerolineales bacterium]